MALPVAQPPAAAAVPRAAPEIWAGIECSVVRIGDRVVDELVLTGHRRRRADLRRLGALGVRAVRFPVLWEARRGGLSRSTDWASLDRRFDAVREAGLRPIVGLFHGGSGRRGELLDPTFPKAFGAYAEAIARRYPWVDAYLPVNEPLTTARFAGLYGLWHPHGRDAQAFAALVAAAVLAYRAAARAIREVRPDALIVATEDVGETFATQPLRAQADFDRERRWLALDAINGRVDRSHRLHAWLVNEAGLSETTLHDLAADAEPPDLLGLHHYPTSDRFLDHRLERYPAWSHGGNERLAYADVEAVRVLADERDGFREAIGAAWDRYGLPMALTEVHIGGEPRDQRAWWWSAIRSAEAAAHDGVDLRAVTAWAAFGSWEWPSLLTRADGIYEPGLFDTRERPPRATVLATDVALAASGRRPRSVPVGWWQRPGRLLYPPLRSDGSDA